METVFLPLLIAAAGIFSAFCAFKDYDWFMEHRKARFMSGIIGRRGARFFYIALGLVLVTVGAGMAFGAIPLSASS